MSEPKVAAPSEAAEDVESFRRRSRKWIEEYVPRAGKDGGPATSLQESVRRSQAFQQRTYDASPDTITWPKEDCGLELTPAHTPAFTGEPEGYVLSASLGVIGPALLDFGATEHKATYLPSLLRGDTLRVQFLSEPSCGSDMAKVQAAVASGVMAMSDTLNLETVGVSFCSPHGPHVQS